MKQALPLVNCIGSKGWSSDSNLVLIDWHTRPSMELSQMGPSGEEFFNFTWTIFATNEESKRVADFCGNSHMTRFKTVKESISLNQVCLTIKAGFMR